VVGAALQPPARALPSRVAGADPVSTEKRRCKDVGESVDRGNLYPGLARKGRKVGRDGRRRLVLRRVRKRAGPARGHFGRTDLPRPTRVVEVVGREVEHLRLDCSTKGQSPDAAGRGQSKSRGASTVSEGHPFCTREETGGLGEGPYWFTHHGFSRDPHDLLSV